MNASWLASAVTISVIGCGGADGPEPPSAPVFDVTPRAVTPSGTVTFAFSARRAPDFECKVDDLAPRECTSPHTVGVLEGIHTLSITAFFGDMGSPPLVFTWRVDETPPDTTITTAPAAVESSLTATFRFRAIPVDDANDAECALDSATFTPCVSPHMVTTTAGPHTFYVRAVDLAGNRDPTPAQHAWTIN